MGTTFRILIVAGIVAFGAGLVGAEQPADSAKTAQTADPAKEAAMAAWHQASTPGENHKALEPFAGNWNYTMKWWMTPDAPAETMSGSTSNNWVMGGRFLKQEVRGAAMQPGQPPFEGLGYIGYNNMKKQYESVWLDNMSTGVMSATGQYDSATKTLTEEGSFACPMTGETNRKFRGVWKVVDPTHNSYESYSWTPEGKEFKSMEIQYTKAQ